MSTTATTEEQLKKMYEGQLTSQKEQLKQDYTQADADLTAQKEKLQKATDENLRRRAVDAQVAAMNNEEYYAASGLSSGAKAQARLSMGNQLQADMTALRAAQQEADAEVERTRGLLAKEYASAISKAQADNDLALAKALYEQAEKEDAELLAKQESAATLMAQAGDYTRLGTLYGLSDAEVKKLSGASSGSTGNGGTTTRNWDNEGISKAKIKEMQKWYGTKDDGYWGSNSADAAGGRSAKNAWDYYLANKGNGSADNAESFINRNMTREQAISRGIGETSWMAMILKALNNANLTAEEFAALEKYYGIS